MARAVRARPCPSRRTPAALLGAVMGEMARVGRDKVTFLLHATWPRFGMWLEQLIAESTGKEGTGLRPGHRRARGHARWFTAATGSLSIYT